MAERSGFFNARLVDGAYDRRYNADDYRGNLGAIISNGVRRAGDGKDSDLKVQAVGGSMDYTVAIGRAWINGAWYFNDSTYMGTVPPANVTLPRKDRVVLRFNSTANVRSITLAYLEGVPSENPQYPEPQRLDDGSIYDIVLADIDVGAGATTINQSNITDQRPNGAMKEIVNDDGSISTVDGDNLCGWITTPIGYAGFFSYLDGKVLDKINEYNEEWNSMKDDWASVTLFTKYEARETLTATTTSMDVPIIQFNPDTDIIDIYVNGIYAFKGDDYVINGNVVNFTIEKPIGTEISFSVYKSIDSRGDVNSFIVMLTELQNQVNELSNLDEYRYICNGVDDNVRLSEMCNAFFDGTDDGKELKINIYGEFRCSAPVGGDGTSVSRYRWITVSPAGSVSRKITLDFSNCSKITVPMQNGSYNIMFYGKDMTIIGASVEAGNTSANTAMEIFSSTDGNIKAVRCRFNITGYHKTFIAETGTFDDCIATCTVMNGEAYCFATNSNGLIRIIGGEYKAYTMSTSSNSMVVKQTDAGAVLVAYGMNCPVVSRQGYRQTHAINATGGYAQVTDTITTLTVVAGTIRTTIPANKPERG